MTMAKYGADFELMEKKNPTYLSDSIIVIHRSSVTPLPLLKFTNQLTYWH